MTGAETVVPGILYEKRPARGIGGEVVEGLYNAWITLDNPSQYNAYMTEMCKGAVLASRAASNARDVVAVVFTGAGDKAFCTGGNTKNTPNTTPATTRNTGSTCASSTTWSRPSSPATSRWSAA